MVRPRIRLRSSCTSSTRENVGLGDGFEADAEVETARCWVVRFEADLDTRCAGLGKQVDTGGEYVAGKSSSLVIVFGAHGFDETRSGLGVVPEQSVRRDSVATVDYEQVEIGAVQRSLTQARLDVDVVPFGRDHVMRALHRVEATGQPIVVVQRADLWPSGCAQPRLDHPVLLDRKATAGQHLTHHVIGAVNFEFDDFKAGFSGVSKPALDDLGNPVGSCVGNDDRVESYTVATVDCDHGRFWAAEVIKPEELTEMVGCARCTPAPLQVGGFVQPLRGVSAAYSLQERRRSFQVVNANPMVFSRCWHFSNLGRGERPTTPDNGWQASRACLREIRHMRRSPAP